MAWGRRKGYGSNEPAPPRAFSGSAEISVYNAIKKAAEEQRWMVTRDVQLEELRQLYIKPYDREPLRHAFNAVQFDSIDQGLSVNSPILEGKGMVDGQNPYIVYEWDWTSSKGDGFFVPRYTLDMHFTIAEDAPDELVAKYCEIHERLQQIAYDWGLVRHVFSQLNVNGYCNTPQQMRFVWPAIRHLVDRFDKKLGNSLVDASARAGDKARVPANIVEYMVPTVNTVARSLLLTDVNLNEKRPQRVKLSPVRYHVEGDHQLESQT